MLQLYKDILDHLLDRCGKITPSDLERNSQRFHEGIDMSEPIDAYFTRIDDCVQYATDGKMPFLAKQILNTATFAMQKTGLFRKALRQWKAKGDADKTWSNFKKFFVDEYSKLKEEEQQITAKESEFHQANIMENVSHALDNLGNAAIADRDATAKLIAANKELTESNKLLADQIKKLQDNYTTLTESVKALKFGKGTNNNKKIEYDLHGYCWSCGFRVTKDHNSVTCPNKKEGHQDAATRFNTMGGCQAHK